MDLKKLQQMLQEQPGPGATTQPVVVGDALDTG
jgi:hypothetical protein